MKYIESLSAEERIALLEAGREAKRINQEQAKKLYKQDYGTDVEQLWKALAAKANVKLPRGHTKAPTAIRLKKFGKLLSDDLDVQAVLFGEENISLSKAIKKHNDRLGDGNRESLRAACCYLLEALAMGSNS